MKNLIYLILLLGFMSCNNLEEIDSPEGTVTEAAFFKNEADAQAAVMAIYDGMQQGNFYSTYAWGDCLTDDAVFYIYDTRLYGGLAWGLQTAVGSGVNDYHERIFRICYQTIVRANFALRGLESMDEKLISAEKKNALMAEAKFLRAFLYHYMNVRWGGVAIASFTDQQPKRLSEKESNEWIIKELSEGDNAPVKALPLSRKQDEKGRVTQAGAWLLLSRVQMFDGNNAEAAKSAKIAMTSAKGDHGLIAKYPDIFSVFNESNKEVIFEITFAQNLAGEDASYYHFMAYANFDGATNVTGNYPWSNGPIIKPVQNLSNEFEMAYDDNNDGKLDRAIPFNPSSFNINNDDVNQFKNRDPRLDYILAHAGSDYFGDNYSSKFLNAAGSTGFCFRKFTTPDNKLKTQTDRKTENNMIVYRYADVLLLYAEAQNESAGPDASVYDAVNQVRERAGMPGLQAGLSKEAMRMAIRHERRVEFAGENLRYEDLRRWKQVKEAFLSKPLNHRAIAGSQALTSFSDYKILWPIPQLEIDLNPNLAQNPGY